MVAIVGVNEETHNGKRVPIQSTCGRTSQAVPSVRYRITHAIPWILDGGYHTVRPAGPDNRGYRSAVSTPVDRSARDERSRARPWQGLQAIGAQTQWASPQPASQLYAECLRVISGHTAPVHLSFIHCHCCERSRAIFKYNHATSACHGLHTRHRRPMYDRLRRNTRPQTARRCPGRSQAQRH